MLIHCPHCGLPALSPLRKLALGPSVSIACRHCGLRVGTQPMRALVSFIPSGLLVGWVLAAAPRDPALTIALGVLAFTVTCLLYLYWVPLIRRQFTVPEAVREAQERAGVAPARGPD